MPLFERKNGKKGVTGDRGFLDGLLEMAGQAAGSVVPDMSSQGASLIDAAFPRIPEIDPAAIPIAPANPALGLIPTPTQVAGATGGILTAGALGLGAFKALSNPENSIKDSALADSIASQAAENIQVVKQNQLSAGLNEARTQIQNEMGKDITDSDFIASIMTSVGPNETPEQASSKLQQLQGLNIAPEQIVRQAQGQLNRAVQDIEVMSSQRDATSERLRQLQQKVDNPEQLGLGSQLGIAALSFLPGLVTGFKNKQVLSAGLKAGGQAINSLDAQFSAKNKAALSQLNATQGQLTQLNNSIINNRQNMANSITRLGIQHFDFIERVRNQTPEALESANDRFIEGSATELKNISALSKDQREKAASLVTSVSLHNEFTRLEDSIDFQAAQTIISDGDLGFAESFPLLSTGQNVAKPGALQYYDSQIIPFAKMQLKATTGETRFTDNDALDARKSAGLMAGDKEETKVLKQQARYNKNIEGWTRATPEERRYASLLHLSKQLQPHWANTPYEYDADNGTVRGPNLPQEGLPLEVYAQILRQNGFKLSLFTEELGLKKGN